MKQIAASLTLALPDRAKFLSAVETLAIGAAGGLLFLWANLPGGLISGAMIAVAVAALAGRPLSLPPHVTQTLLVLLGISLGSVVSQELIQQVSAYPITIALMILARSGRARLTREAAVCFTPPYGKSACRGQML